MRYDGVRSWPPVWVGKYGAAELTGEIGKLTYVGSNPRQSPRPDFLAHDLWMDALLRIAFD